MRVLVACEESQRVTIEFRLLGHEAFSCDIKSTSGEHPEWHLQQDVRLLLQDDWDLIVAFPPCTHLSSSGALFWPEKKKDGRQQEGIDFFLSFIRCKCYRLAIENPIGIMSSIYRKPNQIIQPWMFGDPFTKTTCLWLRGLPKLVPTKIVDKGDKIYFPSGKSMYSWYAKLPSSSDRSELRSKTFPGIAKAMATQWGIF